MHELLAPIVFVLAHAKEENKDEAYAALKFMSLTRDLGRREMFITPIALSWNTMPSCCSLE